MTRILGSGDPVVLVHGFGVSGAYMLPLAHELAAAHSVVVPDLPGGGIAGMADALGRLLDEAEVHEPAVVANSLGCQIVTELALRRPLGPLVLVGPTVEPARRAAPRQLLALLRDSAHEPFSLLSLAARDMAGGLTTLLTTARAAVADRIEDRLPLIDQPAAVVWGDQDGFVSRAWAEEAAALLPHGRLVPVPGEAHAVHYTRPGLVARVLRTLVEEGEHGVGELAGRLEHRHVSAPQAHEPRPGQEPLPVLR